jgi:hypothetical protein
MCKRLKGPSQKKLCIPGMKNRLNAHSITVNVKLINIYFIQSLHFMTATIVRQAAESLALEQEKACGLNSFYFCEQKMDIIHND